MDKPIIIAISEMKEDVTKTVNKYVNEIPAEIIADTIDKISAELRLIAQQQLAQAKDSFEKAINEKTE